MKKIVIDGVIGWDIWGSQIRRELESTNEEIIVEISSPGGSVFDGLEIFNIIRDYSRNVNSVTTKIIGLAASMASYIALAGNRIIAEDNAVYMIHNVWGLSIGDHRDMRKEADIFEQLTNLLAKTYSKKTGKALSEIRKLMDDETWLFGDEMVKAGFVDEIIEAEKKEENDKNMLLTLAKGRVENCFSMMEKSEKSKNDLKKAAALITNFNFQDQDNNINKKQNLMEENKNMEDINKLNSENEELKQKNADLENKLKNIKAHLKFKDIAAKEVLDNIENEKPFDIEAQAEYGKLQLMGKMKEDRKEDNVEDLKTNPEDDKVETDNYTAQLKKRRGVK